MNDIVKKEPEQDKILSIIEKLASMPNLDPSKMDMIERMFEMHERTLNRAAKEAFNRDMALLQADLPTIDRKGAIVHNNRLISNYALFEDIIEAIRPHLMTHGFSVSFRSQFDNNIVFITGILSHRSGHNEETTIRLPFDQSGAKNGVQAIGSSISYGKRYVICMLLNIATGGEDDDGNSAGKKQALDNGRVKRLRDAIKSMPYTEPEVCKGYGVERFEDLPETNFTPLLNRLKRMKQESK